MRVPSATLPPPTLVRSAFPFMHVALLGIPDDRNSSFLRGPAAAPPLIREAIVSDSANSYCELGVAASEAFVDHGDLRDWSHETIEATVRSFMDEGHTPCILGGDHAITFPIIAAMHTWRRERAMPPFAILHFDAHTDTYDELDGNRLSHACGFARCCELPDPPQPLVQLGIRTLTPHLREQAAKFGTLMLQCKDFPESRRELRKTLDEWLAGVRDVYISVDLDALDPAFAPGVSHHEPGGLSTRDLLNVLHALPAHCRVIGSDLVEYNPERDINGVTAMVAAKIIKEMIGLQVLTATARPEGFEPGAQQLRSTAQQ